MNERDKRIASHVRRRLTGVRRSERRGGVELSASWVRRLRAARRRRQRRSQTMMVAAPVALAAGAA